MESFDRIYEQFKVAGKDLVAKIHELIHEGNVRRIVIKDESGHTFMEIPLTVAAIGVIAAPLLAAIGAIATVVGKFEVVVERNKPAAAPTPTPPTPRPTSRDNKELEACRSRTMREKAERGESPGSI